jgi:hypothetical protein
MDRFERRLDRILNAPFQRAFKSEVQPVEVASALRRECDDKAAIVSRERTIVPNEFVIELGPHDDDRLRPYEEPLTSEFVAIITEHAQAQHYAFTGPVTVALERHEELGTGVFRIRSQAKAGVVDQFSPHGVTAAVRPLGRLEIGGEVFPLTRPVTTLGRGSDVDLRLDDPGVSRRHLEIVMGGEPSVVDLGSTNGTFVNGEKVSSAKLLDGFHIRLGSTEVVFRESREA